MMKHEFEELTGLSVSAEDYIIIETVYMYYPGIETKTDIVTLFKLGMTAIKDLYPRADKIAKHEQEISRLQNEIRNLRG
jgi:hypothetical protein